MAGLGLALVAATQIAAFAGYVLIPGDNLSKVFGGILVLWLPMVLLASRVAYDVSQRDMWRALLLGCPRWMRWPFFAILAYAIGSFLTARATAPGEVSDPARAQLLFAPFLIFYSVAFAVFLSLYRRPDLLRKRQCVNGHGVSVLMAFCPQCGVKLDGSTEAAA